MKSVILCIVLAAGLLPGCRGRLPITSEPKGTMNEAREAHHKSLQGLAADDQEEFELAQRGLIASEPAVDIRASDGQSVWDMKSYGFLGMNSSAPDTVNPVLWRHAQRNTIHGLFKVTERVDQVRGYDISNISFIEGKTGYIVIDPLMSIETARAALELLYKHLPKKPVLAIIYTHSHVDHWGGAKGIVLEEDVKTGKVRIIAPQGFMKEAISENVMVGKAMARRASYLFGTFLPRGPKGQVDAGVGKGKDCPLSEKATGPLQIHARPDRTPHQPRVHDDRMRGEGPASAQSGERMVQSQPLRHGQLQCEGRLPKIPWLV